MQNGIRYCGIVLQYMNNNIILNFCSFWVLVLFVRIVPKTFYRKGAVKSMSNDRWQCDDELSLRCLWNRR